LHVRRLALFVVHHRWIVIVLAALFLPLAAILGGGVAKSLTVGGLEDPGSESAKTAEAISARFSRAGQSDFVVLVTAKDAADSGDAAAVDDGAVARQGTSTTEELGKEDGVVQASSYWTSGNLPPLRSEDGRQALIFAALRGDLDAKVKVAEKGQTLSDDIARVEAVRDAIGPRGNVRVDANGGWTVDEAVSAIAALNLAAHGLEYVEQPCASVEDLASVRRRVGVPIAADESIRRAEDPLRVAELAAADIAVLKVAPLGGVHACLRIAEQIGLPVVVSSAIETSIGLAAGLALAAALPELPYACGLATTSLLGGDVVAEPLVPVDGFLPVGRQALDAKAYDAVAADAETDARWQARLADVRAVLA